MRRIGVRMEGTMRVFNQLLAVAALVLVSGCAGHIQYMTPYIYFDEHDDDGLIVLRVSAKADVMLARGRINRDGWIEKGLSDRTQFHSEDGFVIASVSPTGAGEAYGVIAVRPDDFTDMAAEPAFTYSTALWGRSSAGGIVLVGFGVVPALAVGTAVAIAESLKSHPTYIPTVDIKLPTFTVVAGKVTCVGAIRIDASKDVDSDDPPEKIGITPITSPADTEAVARYLAKHYPKVRGKVTTNALQMTRRNEYTD